MCDVKSVNKRFRCSIDASDYLQVTNNDENIVLGLVDYGDNLHSVHLTPEQVDELVMTLSIAVQRIREATSD